MKFRFCGDLDCPDWVLAEIATLSKMSSIRMKVLVVQVLSHCLKGTFNYEKVLKIASDNTDGLADIKGAIAAIHFIITNAAKYDVDDKSLVLEVQQLGLPKENTEAMAKQYRDTKEMLQARFAEDSYRVTKLLQVDWRVDQVLASSSYPTSAVDGETNDSTATAVVAPEESAGPSIHLNLKVDTMPYLGAAAADSDQPQKKNSNSNKRFQDVAFELSANKLDVLIHELTHAQKLLQNMDN